jgi:DNA-binding SARP family transcriptional activator
MAKYSKYPNMRHRRRIQFVRYAVLGALEVTRDNGSAVEIPQARLRSLLTVLLVHCNESLSSERVLWLLFGDNDPACGIHAVHSYASALRRTLLPEHPISSERPGYRLRVPQSSVDLFEFRRMSGLGSIAYHNGDVQQALSRLGRACALWRNPALPEFPSSPDMTREAEGLVREFQVSRDLYVDVRMAAGRWHELIPELHATTRNEPGHERAWAQLMLALYRSGLRARALETFLIARQEIIRLAGISPGNELVRLHQLMLQDDPALTSPSVPAIPPGQARTTAESSPATSEALPGQHD